MEDRDERHDHKADDTSATAEQPAASEQTEQPAASEQTEQRAGSEQIEPRGRGEGEECVRGETGPHSAGLHDIDEGVFAEEIATVLKRREAAAKRPDPGADSPPASGARLGGCPARRARGPETGPHRAGRGFTGGERLARRG